jgi:hypothetical protein
MTEQEAQAMVEVIKDQLPPGWNVTGNRMLWLVDEWRVDLEHDTLPSAYVVRNQADWERFTAAGGNPY